MNKKSKRIIKISIISPLEGQVFKLGTAPVETKDIILQAKVFQDGDDISNSVKVNWQLKLNWQATYKLYQTRFAISGNPVTVKFETGGVLNIRVSIIVDKIEYLERVKVAIIGTNPGKEQLINALDSDFLKAVAWRESTWQQFDDRGLPLPPIVLKGQKVPSMRGLFQISEWWWAEERTPLPLKDFNRMAWQWRYNLEAAKQILDYIRNRVLKNFPDESAQKRLDWTLKAYKLGSSVFNSKANPSKYKYVIDINSFIKNKPWEK